MSVNRIAELLLQAKHNGSAIRRTSNGLIIHSSNRTRAVLVTPGETAPNLKVINLGYKPRFLTNRFTKFRLLKEFLPPDEARTKYFTPLDRLRFKIARALRGILPRWGIDKLAPWDVEMANAVKKGVSMDYQSFGTDLGEINESMLFSNPSLGVKNKSINRMLDNSNWYTTTMTDIPMRVVYLDGNIYTKMDGDVQWWYVSTYMENTALPRTTSNKLVELYQLF